MSHLVGLTKHGKEEVKFVNCTEIQAVHFRGQLWDQIILIMQISSPSAGLQLCLGTKGRICFPSCDPCSHSPPAGPGQHPAAREGVRAACAEGVGGPGQTSHRDPALFLSLALPKSGKS